ncbi:uncharacterized protein EV154DRAFT_475493 [Mucor mucedo]|uniref:uncharacterized protein n=1 Tax=Mucor mucedo TaxID=29922 RepID=UPI002220053F|nr:uncharacterized protein EV154DRAFT_475493 [Mucor mucedo]KAI7897168.1 hypothetical protein EV154DRAFT_475493 [Mucor mucedo]
MSTSTSDDMVRAVFNEVIELKSSVLRLDERFAIQFSPAPNKENVTNFHAFATAVVSQGIDSVAKEREMSRVNAHPDCLGARCIVATLPGARIGFQPTRTNKTPCANARIDALIVYLWKKKHSNSSAEIGHANFATSWGSLSPQGRTYYALRLESDIFDYGYQIYKCNKKWAANLLIQDTMKGQRQSERRRFGVFPVVEAPVEELEAPTEVRNTKRRNAIDLWHVLLNVTPASQADLGTTAPHPMFWPYALTIESAGSHFLFKYLQGCICNFAHFLNSIPG